MNEELRDRLNMIGNKASARCSPIEIFLISIWFGSVGWILAVADNIIFVKEYVVL